MAFFCPSIGGRKPTAAGKYKVYTLKKARKRKLQTLKPLLPGGGDVEMEVDQDDDSDSGISQVYSPAVQSSFSLPDIAKTELASRLAAATPEHPAHIKARVLWKYESMDTTDLKVDKGETVLLLYRERSKVFALNNKGKRGFLPFNYCSVLRKNDFVASGYLPRAEQTNGDRSFRPVRVYFHDQFPNYKENNNTTLLSSRNSCFNEKTNSSSILRCRSDESLCGRNKCKSRSRQLSASLEDLPDDDQTTAMVSELIRWDRKAPETYRRRQKVQVTHFRKFENEAVMVLFDFRAADENDLNVYRGEVVTVLNRDDEDWWWVMRADGEEGFIPSSYVSIEAVRMSAESTPRSTDSTTSGSSEGSMNQVRFQDPLCTIHSYIIEDSESDSGDDFCLDSKWSTWC